MLIRRKYVAIASSTGAVVALLALLLITNLISPTEGGPAVMLLVLALIYVISLAVCVLMETVATYVYRLLVPRRGIAKSPDRQSRQQRKRFAICLVVSAIPMLAISLNSIGQVNIAGIGLIAATELVAIFYIVRRMS